MRFRSSARPLVYDATHLVARMNRLATTGIDRVDLAYARHFSAHDKLMCGAHFGLWRPHIYSPERMRRLVHLFEMKLGESDDTAEGEQWRNLRGWLLGRVPEDPLSGRISVRNETDWRIFARQSAWRLTMEGRDIPRDALYLNIAQTGLEFPRFFKWLKARPDVLPVFMVHDLLPLDVPTFFPDGYQTLFKRRIDTVVSHARALICSSQAVGERLDHEYRLRGHLTPPIHVAHLPSPVGEGLQMGDVDEELRTSPYFVLIGTLEPRKNHLTILNIWSEIAKKSDARLVLVGAYGWHEAPIIEALKTLTSDPGRVRHEMGLPRNVLRRLLANARALLSPSFAEGYGLPLAEALAVGTPVIASDIPVFREVTQNIGTFLAPNDREAWRATIENFADMGSPYADLRRSDVKHYIPPTQETFFRGVEAFLASL